MTEYALVIDGAVIEYRNYAPNVDQTKLANSKPRMLPVVRVNDAYDPVSQNRTGPVVTVSTTQVTWTYTVTAKTVGEIDAMRSAKHNELQHEFARRLSLIVPPGAQFALFLTGLMGILGTGLNRAAWPAPIKNIFDPLYTLATSQGSALHATWLAKEAEVAALTTAASINAYDVTVGW